MNFDWVYDIPALSFAALIVGAFCAFGIIGLLITRWLTGLRRTHVIAANDIVGFYFGAVVGFYGITLGLISVGVWQTYSEAETKATMEATTIESLFRTLGGYPEPLRTEMQAKVMEYTEHVITGSWPAQRKGERPSGGTAMMTALQKLLFAYEPQTQGQTVIHEEAIRQFNRTSEYRRLRSLSTSAGLPGTIWLVVMIGAAASILLTWLFSVENLRRHVFLTGLYSGLIGLLVFLIAVMDNPYRGEISVSPEAYELVLSRMKKM